MKQRHKCPLSRHIPHRCDSVSVTKWPQGVVGSQRGLLCNDTAIQWQGGQKSPAGNCKPRHLITSNGTSAAVYVFYTYHSGSEPVPLRISLSLMASDTVEKAGQEKYEGEQPTCFSPYEVGDNRQRNWSQNKSFNDKSGSAMDCSPWSV